MQSALGPSKDTHLPGIPSAATLPLLLAFELLTGCERKQDPVNTSPQPAREPVAAIVSAPSTLRAPLPMLFPLPPAPAGFKWLEPTRGSGLDSRSAVTLDHAVSYMAALFTLDGDPRSEIAKSLTIVGDDASQLSNNAFQGDRFGAWWVNSEGRMKVDTNSLPREALNPMSVLVTVGHELDHALRSKGRKLNFREMLQFEVSGYGAGAEDARRLGRYVDTLAPQGPLTDLWRAAIKSEELDQLCHQAEFKLRLTVLDLQRGFEEVQPFIVSGQIKGDAIEKIRRLHASSTQLSQVDYTSTELAAVQQLFSDSVQLGTSPGLGGFLPLAEASDGTRQVFELLKLEQEAGQAHAELSRGLMRWEQIPNRPKTH